jgi:hypothetical protein
MRRGQVGVQFAIHKEMQHYRKRSRQQYLQRNECSGHAQLEAVINQDNAAFLWRAHSVSLNMKIIIPIANIAASGNPKEEMTAFLRNFELRSN